MDFRLNQEQLAWQKQIKEFTAKTILPRTDLDQHGHFPLDIFEHGFKEGLITGMLPKKYGGGGRSLFEMALAAEEVAYGDLGVSTSMFLLLLATGSILKFGTEEQKQKWITPLSQKLTFASHAWTEPEGSSNLYSRAASTVAKSVSGGFLINGKKSTISNANVATFYTLFARIEGKENDLSCFIVPRSSPGIAVSNPYKKMGQRASDTGEIIFTDVFVPVENQIGQNGQGKQIGMHTLKASRVGISAMSVGVARRARDIAKLFAHTRIVGDSRPLIQQQDFLFQLAEMETDIELVRSLAWRACSEVEHAGPEATKLSSCAKLAGGNMAVKITNQVSELLGAQGFLESGKIEKLIRDAKVLQIYEGTSAIQKILIADTVSRIGQLKAEVL